MFNLPFIVVAVNSTTPNCVVPALTREYVYLGSRLLASFAPDEDPAAVARVTGVAVSSTSIVMGTQVTVTVAGEAVPCPSVQVNYGDGTTTSYALSSPYALPLAVTHTYTTAGLYTIIATGQTTANGPCGGTVSTPIEVTSAEAVTNGDFSQGLNQPQTAPVGWSMFSGGTALAWSVATGLEFYRPTGSTSGGAEQTTSLALPARAPLEATFTLDNTDTVAKRVSVIIRSSGWDDLVICNFILPASQAATGYTMRMHTTVAWSAAAIDFYAADVNTSGTGRYQLDDVSLTYQPANSSAKTDCVDANAPTSGGTSGGTLLTNGDFADGTTGWTLSGSMTSQVTSGVLEYYRTTGGTTPVVGQATGTSVSANQRLTTIFEMANTSVSRQRVTVSLQESDASSFVSCVFWLPAGTERRAYAMTTFAPVAWTNATWAVVPSNGGTETSHGWLQLDTVSFAKTTNAILGTECFEPGSFTVSEGAPVPVPVPTPESLAASAVTLRAELAPALLHGATSRAPVLPTSHGDREVSDGSDVWRADPPREAVTVLVTLAGSGTGSVTSSPTGVSCSGADVSCPGWFAEGTTVTFTATPASGHTFAGWSGACTGTSTCQVFIDGEQTVTATFSGPPTLTYYHTDLLGSVRAITDANGDPVARLDYFPFGESSASLSGDPRKFLGQERDAETAFDYLGARYYRNVWGQFTSVDPIVSAGAMANPQLWNRYAYALNGPLRYSDPAGLAAEDGGHEPYEMEPEGSISGFSMDQMNQWVNWYFGAPTFVPFSMWELFEEDPAAVVLSIAWESRTDLGALAYAENTASGTITEYEGMMSTVLNRVDNPRGFLARGVSATLSNVIYSRTPNGKNLQYQGVGGANFEAFRSGRRPTFNMLRAAVAELLVHEYGPTTSAVSYICNPNGREPSAEQLRNLGNVQFVERINWTYFYGAR